MLAALPSWRAEIELDASFHERMRNLEIGGAEQAEASARAVSREVLREHRGDRRLLLSCAYPMSRFGSQVAMAGTSSSRASSSRLMIT